jgi:tripartite-type tricarboxylate transporter receptor subunit TctC
MNFSRRLLLALALVGATAAAVSAQDKAQDYPNHQVNFVVPFAPGGGTDILGRLVGQKLTDRFGKPFVVENRPGAGTVNAAVQVSGS